MSDVKKESIQNVQGTKDQHCIEFKLTPCEGLAFQVAGYSGNYRFTYGNGKYEVSQFHFYDETGIKYHTAKGHFDGAFGSAHRCVKFNGALKMKRTKLDNIDFAEAYKVHLIFFVTRGRTSPTSITTADIYVPMSYLNNCGYEIVKEVVTSEYSITTRHTLYAPEFNLPISFNYVVRIDVVKQDIIKAINQCSTSEEIRRVLSDWEFKI